jgi:hypothetical protein
MTYGNGVRDDSQQLRAIQDLIAQLDAVNKKLAQPSRVMAVPVELSAAKPVGV